MGRRRTRREVARGGDSCPTGTAATVVSATSRNLVAVARQSWVDAVGSSLESRSSASPESANIKWHCELEQEHNGVVKTLQEKTSCEVGDALKSSLKVASNPLSSATSGGKVICATTAASTSESQLTASWAAVAARGSKGTISTSTSAALTLTLEVKEDQGRQESNGMQDPSTSQLETGEKETEPPVFSTAEPTMESARPATTTVVKLPKDSTQKEGSRVTTISSEMSIETLRLLRQYGAGFFLSSNARANPLGPDGNAIGSTLKSTHYSLSTTSVLRSTSKTEAMRPFTTSINSSSSVNEKPSSSSLELPSNGDAEKNSGQQIDEREYEADHSGTPTVVADSAEKEHASLELPLKRIEKKDVLPHEKEKLSTEDTPSPELFSTLTRKTSGADTSSAESVEAKDEEATADLLTLMFLRYCRNSETFTAASAKRSNLNPQSSQSEANGSASAEPRVGTTQDGAYSTDSLPMPATTFPENEEEDGDKAPSTWSVKQVTDEPTETNGNNIPSNTYGGTNTAITSETRSATETREGLKPEANHGEEVNAPPTPAPPIPELVLFEELTDLLMTRDVTAHLLEVVRELLSHTKVIPHYHFNGNGNTQQQNFSRGGNHGGAGKGGGLAEGRKSNSTSDNACDTEVFMATALQVEQQKTLIEEARRRECARQVILILLKQMEEKKINEERWIETPSTETLLKQAKEALETIPTSSPLAFETTTAPPPSTTTSSTSSYSIPVFSTSCPLTAFSTKKLLSETSFRHFSTTLQTTNQVEYLSSAAPDDRASWPLPDTNPTDEQNCLPSMDSSPMAFSAASLFAPPKLSSMKVTPFSMANSSSATPDIHFSSPSLAASTAGGESPYENPYYASYASRTQRLGPVSVPVSMNNIADCTRVTRFGVQQFSNPSNTPQEGPRYPNFSSDAPLRFPGSSFLLPSLPLFAEPTCRQAKSTRANSNASKGNGALLIYEPATDLLGSTESTLEATCSPSESVETPQTYSPFHALLPLPPITTSPYSASISASNPSEFLISSSVHGAAFTTKAFSEGALPLGYNPFAPQVRKEMSSRHSSSSLSSFSSSPDPFILNPHINEEWWSGEEENSKLLPVEAQGERSLEASVSPSLDSVIPRETLCLNHQTGVLQRKPQDVHSVPSMSSDPASQQNSVSSDMVGGNMKDGEVAYSSDDWCPTSELKNDEFLFVSSYDCTEAGITPSTRTTLNAETATSEAGESTMSPPLPREGSEDDQSRKNKVCVSLPEGNGYFETKLDEPKDEDPLHFADLQPEAISTAKPSSVVDRGSNPIGSSVSLSPFEQVSLCTPLEDRKVFSTQDPFCRPYPEMQLNEGTAEEYIERVQPGEIRDGSTLLLLLASTTDTASNAANPSPFAVWTTVDSRGTELPFTLFHDLSVSGTPSATSKSSSIQQPQTCKIEFNSSLYNNGDEATERAKTPLAPPSALLYNEMLGTTSVPLHSSALVDSASHSHVLNSDSKMEIALSHNLAPLDDSTLETAPLLFHFDDDSEHPHFARTETREEGLTEEHKMHSSEQQYTTSENMTPKPEQDEIFIFGSNDGRGELAVKEIPTYADAPPPDSIAWNSATSWASPENLWNVNAKDFVPTAASFRRHENPVAPFTTAGRRIHPTMEGDSFPFDSSQPTWPSMQNRNMIDSAIPHPFPHGAGNIGPFISRSGNSWSGNSAKSKKERFLDSTLLHLKSLSSMELCSLPHGPSQRRKVCDGEPKLIRRVEKSASGGNALQQ